MTIKHTGEPPWLILKGLHVLNLDEQNIAWFSSLNLKRSREVVNLGEIDIPHVVGRIIVFDLPTCPVETLDFDHFIGGNFTTGRNYDTY